ncbi:MAG: RNase adapter RapZ [Pseudomonadota bacterium]
MTRLIVLSGLSGSGKSIALHMLEDLGYYCVDNMPAGLLRAFVADTLGTGHAVYQHTAVSVDARNRPADIAKVPEVIRALRQRELNCEVIFLHADEDILLKRYSETRRRHPLSSDRLSLRDAIRHEGELLEPIALEADLIFDTTHTNVHDLRELIRTRVGGREHATLSLQFVSFGYKYGVPADADIVFDVRCLPNPYWEPALRSETGRDASVIAYLDGQPLVQKMLADITGYLRNWLPHFTGNNRSYLTVAVGCTGGQHRSVYLVEHLAAAFGEDFPGCRAGAH